MGFCQLRWETDPKNVFEYVQAFPNDLAGDGGRNRYKYLLKSAYDKNLCKSKQKNSVYFIIDFYRC